MSIDNSTKINQLLSNLPQGIVLQSHWLTDLGYSPSLQQRYRKNNWLQSIGSGAMIRYGDNVEYEGAIYALQHQSGLSIHPAARTALAMQGKTHYLELTAKKAVVFAHRSEALPGWFKKHTWNKKIEFYSSEFLPPDIGLITVELKNFSIRVSDAPRAILECLYLAPDKFDLLESYQMLEGLNNLRPSSIQPLLEKCQSIKVKRLFLYMAEKTSHNWLKHISFENIDLGKGKRSFAKNGVYIPKYQITVPRELEEHGKRSI